MILDTFFWQKYFTVYDYLNLLHPYQDLLKLFEVELKVSAGDKILDAGSGTGNLSIALSKSGATVVAVDSSIEGIKFHKKKQAGIKLLIADLTKELPFPSDSFDKICCNNVVYTLPVDSRQSVYCEFYRVLKPGGYIGISNISINFKPFSIYREHISTSMKRIGFIKTLVMLIRLLIPTLRIFYYNYLISRAHNGGQYSFVLPNEQKKLLIEAGFTDVSDDLLVYAGQAIFNKALKPR